MNDEKDQQTFEYLKNEVLQTGETLAWTGRPSPKDAALLAGMLPTLLHGLGSVAFGIFWIFNSTGMDADWFGLVGIPIIGFGVWSLSEPARNFLRASQTYYAITNKRVLIVEAGNKIKVTSLVGSDITYYHRSDKGNGDGNLRLRRTIRSSGSGRLSKSIQFTDGLWGIADVKGAAEAITVVREWATVVGKDAAQPLPMPDAD